MIMLPCLERAIIAERKLTLYLLNHDHPEGAPKASFLESFGFSGRSPEKLRAALLVHAAAHEIDVRRVTEFGTMYEIVGRLSAPDGRDPVVRVAWIIDTGSAALRFVTLVPDRERNP